jgi:TIR domain/Tetratricopeptide repeat
MEVAGDQAALDFYISYAGQGQDRLWAEWIGGQLRQAGYSVVLDVWSWLPGENIILAREDALRRADRVIAVCSAAYFSGGYTKQDWTAVMAARHGEQRPFIPVWIEDLGDEQLPDVLRAVQPIKLAGVSEEEARPRLLDSLAGDLGPDGSPPFPGGVGPGQQRKPARRGKGAANRGKQPHLNNGAVSDDRFPGTERPDVWRVPLRNRDFTGRDALLVRIREALLDGSAGIAILQGPGGMGKTQLSTEYAHRFASDYDTVWVIDAEQAALISSQLAELAGEMGVATGVADARAATAVVSLLRNEARWLLIFDNVEDPNEILSFLPDGPGHVLITARAGAWDEVGRVIAVDEFSRAESTALLTSRVGGLSRQDASEIAEALGDLPLALAQATGTMQAGVPAAEFQRLLESQPREVLSHGKPRSYGLPLARATIIACGNLAEAQPRAASLLRLCGYLAPEVIPATWFYPALGRASGPWPAAEDDLPHGPWEVKEAFEGIRDYGLGRVDQQGLKIHRLTQAILRDHNADHQAAYQSLVVRMLQAVAPDGTDDPADWPQWARLVPHLLTVTVAGSPAAFRPLACATARYLIVSGQTRAALDLAARLQATWSAELGPDDPDTLAAAEQWGHALRDIGDEARSLEVNRDTYERRRRVLGDDDPATLMSANNLAVSLGGIGRYKEALPIAQDTYERRRRVLGEDHPDTLWSAAGLGETLGELGHLQEALSLEQDAHERRRRVLGEDHPGTLNKATFIVWTLYALNRRQEADALERDVLERYRRVLGEDHHETLSAMSNHAKTLWTLGQQREAAALERDVLERFRRVLGEDHPDTLSSAASLASTLTALGRRKEALPLAREAYGKLRERLGDDHPATLSAAAALVNVLISLQKWNEALPLTVDVLERQMRSLTEDHPDTLRMESLYGQVLLGVGRPRDALPYNKDVYDRRTRALGADHADTGQAAEIFARNLEFLGRKAEAIQLRMRMSKGRRKA